jgi:hypothetical protein
MTAKEMRKRGIAAEAHLLSTRRAKPVRIPILAQTSYQDDNGKIGIYREKSWMRQAVFAPEALCRLAFDGKPLLIDVVDPTRDGEQVEISINGVKRIALWLYEMRYVPEPPVPGNRSRLSALAV